MRDLGRIGDISDGGLPRVSLIYGERENPNMPGNESAGDILAKTQSSISAGFN